MKLFPYSNINRSIIIALCTLIIPIAAILFIATGFLDYNKKTSVQNKLNDSWKSGTTEIIELEIDGVKKKFVYHRSPGVCPHCGNVIVTAESLATWDSDCVVKKKE